MNLKITAVSPDVREWTHQQSGKVFKSYKFKAEGQGEKVFEINQVPETPAPQVGQSLDVEIKGTKEFNGQTFTQVKRISQGRPGGGGGGRPAQDERWVTLRHAQKLAADLILATLETRTAETSTYGHLLADVEFVTQRLFDQGEALAGKS